jgi:hypothetical protein
MFGFASDSLSDLVADFWACGFWKAFEEGEGGGRGADSWTILL